MPSPLGSKGIGVRDVFWGEAHGVSSGSRASEKKRVASPRWFLRVYVSGIPSMSHSHLVFHHLGLAVKKPQAVSAFVLALGYHQGDTIQDPAQKVAAMFCTHDSQPAIEILWPSEPKG